jgi:hypothetical protein
MKLVVELNGAPAQALYLSVPVALLQLTNVLQRHAARGHVVNRPDPLASNDMQYVVVTPEGTIKYRLEH